MELALPATAWTRRAIALLIAIWGVVAWWAADISWRMAALAALGAVAAGWIPRVGRAVVALLGAAAVHTSGWQLVPAVLVFGAGLGSLPRSARWRPPAAALAIGTVALVAVGSWHQALAVLALVALALVPIEEAVGPRVMRAGLALAAVPGLIAVGRAELAVRALVSGSPTEALSHAVELAHQAGLRDLEGRERLALAQSLAATGKLDAAFATVETLRSPLASSVELGVAQIDVRSGRESSARFLVDRLAHADPRAQAPLDDATACLWARALLRRGHRAEALAALRDAISPEARALRGMGTSVVEPERAMSFGGAIRLVASPLPSGCAARGTAVAFTWTWEVQTGFASGENDWAFVQAYGAGAVLSADHLIAGQYTESLRPGQRLTDAFHLSVPLDAPAGRYGLDVGVYDPATGLRLPPLDRPEHQSYEEIGAIEVCP